MNQFAERFKRFKALSQYMTTNNIAKYGYANKVIKDSNSCVSSRILITNVLNNIQALSDENLTRFVSFRKNGYMCTLWNGKEWADIALKNQEDAASWLLGYKDENAAA